MGLILAFTTARLGAAKKMSEDWGMHWAPWFGVMTDKQSGGCYGFIAAGSDASLGGWMFLSLFDNSSNAQATSSTTSEVVKRWNLNGVGYGVMAGYGPSLSLDSADDIALDFLAVGGVSYFYKGASLYSFGAAIGMRFRFTSSVVFAFRMPLVGLAYGRRYNTDSPDNLAAVSGIDNLIQFYSNTLVSMPFITIGYTF